MRQQLYLEQKHGTPTENGGCMFWLQDPVICPSREWQLTCTVVHVAIPLTHWVITDENRLLQLVHPRVDVVTGAVLTEVDDIRLPRGNYSIDALVLYINSWLTGHGIVVTYSENTNMLELNGAKDEFQIGPGTTCGKLLGLEPGQSSFNYEMTGARGVDLSGTGCFYVCSSVRTRNRDPVNLGYSRILAKVPVTKAHNGLERYEAPLTTFGIWDRHITGLSIDILDEDMRPVVFHGGDWSITLEFDVSQSPDYGVPKDYRENLAMLTEALNAGANGQVRPSQDAPPGQRPDAGGGGQHGGAGGNQAGV